MTTVSVRRPESQSATCLVGHASSPPSVMVGAAVELLDEPPVEEVRKRLRGAIGRRVGGVGADIACE